MSHASGLRQLATGSPARVIGRCPRRLESPASLSLDVKSSNARGQHRQVARQHCHRYALRWRIRDARVPPGDDKSMEDCVEVTLNNEGGCTHVGTGATVALAAVGGGGGSATAPVAAAPRPRRPCAGTGTRSIAIAVAIARTRTRTRTRARVRAVDGPDLRQHHHRHRTPSPARKAPQTHSPTRPAFVTIWMATASSTPPSCFRTANWSFEAQERATSRSALRRERP